MAAVLTTSMTLRIILSVRGSLDHGGSFALSASSGATSSRTTHVISGRSAHPTNISTTNQHTYTLDDMQSKPEGEWGAVDADAKSSVNGAENKGPAGGLVGSAEDRDTLSPGVGVKITIDREVGYDNRSYRK